MPSKYIKNLIIERILHDQDYSEEEFKLFKEVNIIKDKEMSPDVTRYFIRLVSEEIHIDFTAFIKNERLIGLSECDFSEWPPKK